MTSVARLVFEVPGDPRGKGRQRSGKIRFGKRKGQTIHYAEKETVSFEAQIKTFAVQAKAASGMSDVLLEGPLWMQVTYYTTPNKEQLKRLQKDPHVPIYSIVKPDGSNVLKIVEDALNGIVYRDDAIIAEGTFKKLVHPNTRIVVSIGQLTD